MGLNLLPDAWLLASIVLVAFAFRIDRVVLRGSGSRLGESIYDYDSEGDGGI